MHPSFKIFSHDLSKLVPFAALIITIYVSLCLLGCTKLDSNEFKTTSHSDTYELLNKWKSLSGKQKNKLVKRINKTKVLIGWDADNLVALLGTPDGMTTLPYEKGCKYFGYSAIDNESVCDLVIHVDGNNKIRSTDLNINP